MKNGLILFMVLITVSGCTSMGTKVSQDAMQALHPGLTTCAHVVEQFGAPTSSTIASNGHRQLVYTYVQSQARPENFIPYAGLFVGGARVEQTQVTIECDRAGVVQTFSSSEGKTEVGTGFISGRKQK